MFDSGAIDANGVARTNSLPFPGLSKSGQVMIARPSQPMPQVRIDVTGQLTFTAMTITALGFSVTGGQIPKLDQIGRAHGCTPVNNAHLVCRLPLETKKTAMYKPHQNTQIN